MTSFGPGSKFAEESNKRDNSISCCRCSNRCVGVPKKIHGLARFAEHENPILGHAKKVERYFRSCFVGIGQDQHSASPSAQPDQRLVLWNPTVSIHISRDYRKKCQKKLVPPSGGAVILRSDKSINVFGLRLKCVLWKTNDLRSVWQLPKPCRKYRPNCFKCKGRMPRHAQMGAALCFPLHGQPWSVAPYGGA